MYNRYVPQPDGSYHRRQMQEANRQQLEYTPPPAPPPAPPQQEYCPPYAPQQQEHCPPPMQSAPMPWSLPSFFKQLLPRGVDTADLLILLLLLLIAGDCEESRNNALMTMALYFIL